jgi:hypothetical protein
MRRRRAKRRKDTDKDRMHGEPYAQSAAKTRYVHPRNAPLLKGIASRAPPVIRPLAN